MDLKIKVNLKELILKLLKEKNQISLREIVEEAGLLGKPSIIRAIQRELASLIKQGIILAQGKARARVYILNKESLIEKPKEIDFDSNESLFKDVLLSKESTKLIQYLSQSILIRKPVGYNVDFLRSYNPNKTSYLSPSLRNELLNAGAIGNFVLPAGTYARKILNRLLIDLSWNSSRLEGNTYSLLETKRLIELGENAAGKDATEAQMILNHKDAIEYIVESANEIQITAHDVRSLHALLSENLLGDPSASGRVRNISVGISGTTYLPLDNPHILQECFNLFIKKMNLIEDPFEQSFFSLIHLSYMQAFEDVNKRTARLVSNIPLIKRNLKPLSFIDINKSDYVTSLLGVYEKNDISLIRDLYVWAYKRSAQRYSAVQQTMGEPNLFKLKYKTTIQEIVRKIILEEIAGPQITSTIKDQIDKLKISNYESIQLFKVIETEIVSLHDGNIARFKIRPSEFEKWKKAQ